MLSTTQAYDTLPSETTSISPSLSQQDGQPRREKADTFKESPNKNCLRSAFISRLWMSWKRESAACVLVLAVPIVIFATLYPHSGQPLPQWPFKISINSLLSVYALVFKAVIGFILTSCIGQLQWAWFSETRPLTDMLHFDSATRGADGALALIWRQRFRQPITFLGCTTLILAVAVDPFTQQLVRPVDCSVEQPGVDAVATLPRANVFVAQDYTYNYLANNTDPNSVFSHFQRPKSDSENILHEAMYSPGRDPPWQCSTGNCTFPETYGSIGICYSCRDDSTDVTFNAICSQTNSSYPSHHPPSSVACPSDMSYTVTSNYTVMSRNTNMADIQLSTEMGSGMVVVAEADSAVVYDESYSGLDFGFLMGAAANTGGRTDWTTIDIDKSTCDSKESASSWGCQGYGAATCSLQTCVQIYNATVVAGHFEERLVESSSDTPWGIVYDDEGRQLYLALIDSHCSDKVHTPTKLGTSMESRWQPYNFNLSITMQTKLEEISLPDDATFLLENGCLYLLNQGYTAIVFDDMASFLKGTVEAGEWTFYKEMLDYPNITNDPYIINIRSFQGPDLIRGIYNWGHTDFERVRSIIANISNSLTTHIRTNGGDPVLPGSANYSREVQGAAYHYATCLEVQWPWLAFPGCLAILTTLFFLMVVDTTARQGTSIWKALPLAWILRAEGPGDRLLSSSDRSCDAMKERSTQIAVHLSDEDPYGPRIRMADLKDPNMF